MSTSGQDRDAMLAPPRRAALAEALAKDAVADLVKAGAPVFVAAGAPPRIVWATRAALDLFGASDLAGLAERAMAASSSGGRRLAELAVGLTPGAPPRLERLRCQLDPADRPLTFLTCRHASPGGGAVFVAAALGQPPVAHASGAPSLEDAHGFAEVGLVSGVAPPSAGLSLAHHIAELRARAGHGTQRFVWQTDAAGVLRFFGPELAQLPGANAPAQGDTLADAFTARHADPDGKVRTALAARRTWSGIDVFWPLLGGQARVPIKLGATPRFTADRAFDGYGGFGVIRLDAIVATDEAVPARVSAPDPPMVPPATDAGAAIPEFSETDVATRRDPPALRIGGAPAEAPGNGPQPDDLAAREALAREAPGAAAADYRQADPGPAAQSVARPDFVLPRGSTPLVPATQAGAAAPHVELPRPETAATDSARPSRSAAARTPRAPSPDDPISLSSVERRAFREIARALGARIEDEAPERDASEPEPAAHRAAPAARIDARIAASHPPAVTAPAAIETESEDASLRRNAANLLDRLPVGVVICRGEVPLYINRTQLDLLGFDSADAFYASGGISRMFHGRQPEALDANAQGGAVPIVSAGGDVLQVDARLQTIAWDGLPATLISFRRAIEPEPTPRQRALELDMRARESELRELHAILDTATDGVAVIDDSGRILSLNRSAQALFGYDQAEVAGEPFTRLFAPASHAIVLEYLGKLKGNGPQSVRNDGREVTGRERQGGHIPLYLTLGRIADSGAGKLCAVLRDLTQFRRAERELQQARKQAEKASALKSDFLAKVSHEIRTPLNSILGFTEVIMDERLGAIGNERYKDYLKDIHASGTHVLSLVNDLLDLSKIEAGKAEMNFVAVDANRVVSESVSLMQPQAAKLRVVMRLSLAGKLPPVVADERSLRQIVLNLLSNAIKFTDAGGQIIVSTAMTESGSAVIRVKDTGIGMDEEEIGQALEPFRQIATSRQTAGTGLGLPLTKALIEANRASLAIRSRRNEGTLVEVIFPATRVLSE